MSSSIEGKHCWSRRRLLKTGGTAMGAALAAPSLSTRLWAQSPVELVHWSWLTASDGEVWGRAIDAFNEAHADRGVRIRMEIIPYEQVTTRTLSAAAAGRAPDFGWGTGGMGARMARDGVTVPMDELAVESGLDLDDFEEGALRASRYPAYGNALFMVPMDLMSLQPLINLDHVAEAGLPTDSAPDNEAELIEWGKAMTVMEGDSVARSGLLMTGSGVHAAVTWGIVAAQMGFERVSEDLKTAAVNPEAGIAAMEWVLKMFDEWKVSSRDITDRYRAFGTSQGSIFWTGPWVLNGYVEQGLNFKASLFPQIGQRRRTYFESGGLEMYAQRDTGRYKATMDAIKWLSDNSFEWTTVGRGASPRKSILSRPDYLTSGHSWDVRGAFVEGMEFADIFEVPVIESSEFQIYSNNNVLARTLDLVWTGQASPADAMEQLATAWQQALAAG